MPITYRFEDFELDPAAVRLSQNGAPLAVEPMVLDVLHTLLRHSGRVVTRDELVAEVWDGRFVSESTISTAVKSARKALGDTGEAQRFIRTVRGRGFQFVGALDPQSIAPEPPTRLRSTRPALYVVAGVAGGPNSAAIPQTLAARVRTVLGRVPLLRVVTPSGEVEADADPRALRDILGVTLVLDIRLSETNGAITADAALIETENGVQLWARSFQAADDAAANGLLESIVARAEPEIVSAMVSEMNTHNEDEAEPLLLRAIGVLTHKGWRRETFKEAERLLTRAVEIDPDQPLSHAYLALIRGLGQRFGILRENPDIIDQVIASADRAIELDNRDSVILGLAGCALADVGENARAFPILTKAIDANPLNGQAKTALGAIYMSERRYDEAAATLEDGMRVSPADSRLSVWGAFLAIAHLARGEPDRARATALAACAEDDRLHLPRLALAGAEVALEDTTAAQRAVRECLRVRPDLDRIEVESTLGRRIGGVVLSLMDEARGRAGDASAG